MSSLFSAILRNILREYPLVSQIINMSPALAMKCRFMGSVYVKFNLGLDKSYVICYKLVYIKIKREYASTKTKGLGV